MPRKRTPEDFSREIESHLQLESDDLQTEGHSTAEAHRRARATFGNSTQARERFYLRTRFQWLDNLAHDLRYALRGLVQSPGFTAVAILTLALGMGANIAIFTLVDTVLLRSLPVSDPSSLYFVRYAGAKGLGIAPPYPCFQRMRNQAKTLASFAAYTGYGQLKIRFGSESNGTIETANGARVSEDYYRVLGLQPALGRLLTPQDENLDPAAAVLSFDYWQSRFSANPSVVGQSFELDGRSFTIVGVSPRGFHGLQPGHEDQITIPMTTMNLGPHDGDGMLVDHNSPWFEAIARLSHGIAPQQARSELDTIFQSYMNEFPTSPESRRDDFNHIELSPAAQGLSDLRKQFSRPLKALMAVVVLVLLIACANITNLLLARASRREREFAVRVALGASRNRLFRQILTETLLLFTLGALASTLVAFPVVRFLVGFFLNGPGGLSGQLNLDPHWDWRVLCFTAILPLFASLLFGAVPVLHALKTDPQTSMKEGPRASGSSRRLNLSRALIVSQIALSLILLVGASLFLRTLRNLESIDPGFNADRVALASIQLLESTYPERRARIAAWDRILTAVRALPGVQSAALSAMTPMDTGGRHVGFHVPGYQPVSDPNSDLGGMINLNTVSEDYFETLNTPLLQGRAFTAGDASTGPQVAILNQTAARQFFPGRSPAQIIGSIVHANELTGRIIGIVSDLHQFDLRQPSGPFLYLPMRQPYDRNFGMTLAVRSKDSVSSLAPELERTIHVATSDALITQPITLSAQLDRSLIDQRLIASLVAAFSALALFLSAVGLYGVLAYTIARRTSELAIRLALGALPRHVIGSILQDTLKLLALGLAIGVPASILLATAAKSLFYEVAPTDPVTQVTAAILLAAVALAASYLPASRVARINPATTLRNE